MGFYIILILGIAGYYFWAESDLEKLGVWIFVGFALVIYNQEKIFDFIKGEISDIKEKVSPRSDDEFSNFDDDDK